MKPFILLILLTATTHAQTLTGTEPTSNIAYALISLEGKLLGTEKQPIPPPRLTAQCTRTPAGKLKFELLADMGSVPAVAFYPPWVQSPLRPFYPPQEGVIVTMDFLGYTKVKPVKRAWRYLNELSGELRYDTPGIHSSNMEDIKFYMQYLRALPTLRLTVPGKGTPPVTAEFDTTRWQATVKAEPLCWASSL